MKRILWTASVVAACLAGSVRGETTPDMLERTLAGVVTIAEYKVASIPTRNARGQLMRVPVWKTRSVDLYGKILDLSGAYAHGSGFLIEHKGKKYVVTNAHVVAWATGEPGAIAAFTADGKRYQMKGVGADTGFDIAVLAFRDDQPGKEAPPLTLRKAAARVGERVFALGNPLGKYPFSVSDGIIGGRDRVGMLTSFGYLQTTATVIWGNSGGPPIDSSGKVVGINTWIEIHEKWGAKFVQPQLNFALESTIAQRVIHELLTNGRVRRAYLGLRIVRDYRMKQTAAGKVVDPSTASQPTVASVVPGSPAAKAMGAHLGARILRVNKKPVRNLIEVHKIFENTRPGGKVTFELDTAKGARTATVATAEMTDKALGELGKHVFATIGYNVVEGAKGLVLKRAGAAGKATPDKPPAKPPEKAPAPDVPGARRHGPYSRRPEELHPFMRLDYEERMRRFRRLNQPPDNLSIIALGLVNDRGGGQFWRTKELAELGIACRLTASKGQLHVAYLNADGKSCSVLKCRLSKSAEVVTSVLLN